MNLESVKVTLNLIGLCVILNLIEFVFDRNWCVMNFGSLIIILVLISLCVIINVIEYWLEWKKWNRGICAKTGKAWVFCEYCNRHRTYTDDCGNSLEIIYDMDRQEKN